MKKALLSLCAIPLLLFSSCTGQQKRTYKEASLALMSKMDEVPDYYSLVGAGNASKKAKREFARAVASDKYDYTVQSDDNKGPDQEFTAVAEYQLLTIDQQIENIKSIVDPKLAKTLSYNKWLYINGDHLRVNYTPALNRFSFEILNEEGDDFLVYILFTIRENEDGKTVFTYKNAYTDVIFGEKAIWTKDIRYVEDEYYECNESRYFYELEEEWLRSYASVDFKTKTLSSFAKFFTAADVHKDHEYVNNYAELIWHDNLIVEVYEQGGMETFNERLQNSMTMFGYLMYDFDGINKIEADREIEYFQMDLDLGFGTPEGRVPFTVETTSGKTFKTNSSSSKVETYTDTIYKDYDTTTDTFSFMLRPYFLCLTADQKDLLDYLEEEYGLTYKYDYDEILAFSNEARERMRNDHMVEYYENLTNARYEKITPETLKASLDNSLKAIASAKDIVTVSNSFSGSVGATDGKLDFSNAKLNVGGASFELEEGEKYYLDYYIINDNYSYTIGSQLLEYDGSAKEFTLNPEFNILKARPTPGEYEVRVALRNYGETAELLACEDIGEIEDEGFNFFRNEDGKLALNVFYAKKA